jgi:hypothetical protein
MAAGSQLTGLVKARVTLRLAVYRQSVRLGAEPHEQILFCNETLKVKVLK